MKSQVKMLIPLTASILFPALAQAEMNVNFGRSDSATGQGPTGADSSYLDFFSDHESPTTGNLQTFNGISFSEGGLGGTYNVGVEITWPDANDNGGTADPDDTKQAYGRTDSNLNDFYNDNIGMDVRPENGGIGAGSRMTLTLTGLEANQDFTLTSYHVDGGNNSFLFTTDASGSTIFTQGRSSTVNVGMTNVSDFQFDFLLTSDATGMAQITYTAVNSTFLAMNGFDLAAIPEPSSFALLSGALVLSVAMVRRRKISV
ncbi:PEP-CTERM sorting domain-containing protein [Coraliomargarita algicola]|uniref:PEP-CTERM sorting domain-containing protein n=1 Tax=Coraliomargarita algicola TaxID=3092156 RepID=A0ABZ0RNB7_9BACT|nr:PEP-CTERM sorting domain-containing protein [Coraliomargarita sp. J2-16]WPJ96598.1 PEP-CTERM sorting domain-containing protein [Coraliomargarita sp. J2-16]